MSPAHGSVVLTESVTDDAKAAWLIDQTIEGAVSFDETTGTKQLLRNPNSTTPLPPVLAKAFGSRSSISLDGYDAQFGAAWSDLSAELTDWRTGSGLWDPAGARRRRGRSVLASAVWRSASSAPGSPLTSASHRSLLWGRSWEGSAWPR